MISFSVLHKHLLTDPILKQKVEEFDSKEKNYFRMKNTNILTREISYIKHPLSEFLINCFKFWPSYLTFPLHQTLEIWANHISSLDSYPWFIFSNWTFYSNVFSSFLGFVHSSNLLISGNSHEIYLIEKTLVFFSKEPIKGYINSYEKNKYNITSTEDNIDAIEDVMSTSNMQKAVELVSLVTDLNQNKTKYERIFKKKGFNKDTLQRLNKIGEHLKNIFGIDKIEGNKYSFILEEENQNIYAETEGNILTMKGREDIKLGRKKPNKFTIPFIGNELYKPNSTYEVPILVDFMIYLSEKLNDYFQTEVINLRFMSTYQFVFFSGIVLSILSFFYVILSIIRFR